AGRHVAGDDRRLHGGGFQRAGAGLVGAGRGRNPPAHVVGRGGAERIAGAAQRRPHRTRALVHPAGQLGADRGARGARLSDRLSRRQRHLRRHVRRRAHRGAARLHRRPHLSDARAEDAAVADVTQTGRAEAAADRLIALARAPAPPPPAYRRLQDVGWSLARLGPILALALAWELAARSGAFTPFMLPTLSSVLERIWSDLIAGDLLINTGVTLYRAMVGFLIGAIAGIVLGMAISRNAIANW